MEPVLHGSHEFWRFVFAQQQVAELGQRPSNSLRCRMCELNLSRVKEEIDEAIKKAQGGVSGQ